MREQYKDARRKDLVAALARLDPTFDTEDVRGRRGGADRKQGVSEATQATEGWLDGAARRGREVSPIIATPRAFR